MVQTYPDREIVLRSLKAALQNWVRSASPEQLWQVHRAGGLGAEIRVEGEDLRVRAGLGGVRGALSGLGMTNGRLPVTEAFRGGAEPAWGTPPPLAAASASAGSCRARWRRRMPGNTWMRRSARTRHCSPPSSKTGLREEKKRRNEKSPLPMG